jgi:hypothetical protein
MLKKNLPIGGALVRIFEITDKNKVVIGISGINIDFDPDIIALDNKISKMELAIDSLVSQLTF